MMIIRNRAINMFEWDEITQSTAASTSSDREQKGRDFKILSSKVFPTISSDIFKRPT